MEGLFSDRRPWDATRLPSGYDGLRTADALRPGRLRNTWPAGPPGQPWARLLQKIPPGTSPGQPPTRFCRNIRPCPPGRHLSAEVRGPQTAPLTRSIGIPCSDRKSRRLVFGHRRHLLYHLFCIGHGSAATSTFYGTLRKMLYS